MVEAEKIKILIVEDHHLTRTGIVMTLQQFERFQVVGEATDGERAVSMSLSLRPDIVLTDIGLPGLLSGIEAVRDIKAKLPQTRMIMITSHAEDETVFAALAAGADGYCLKDIAADQLYLAIMSVYGGASWLDPTIAATVLRASSRSSKKTDMVTLSARELEVLGLIVQGLSNPKIAERLFISIDTVKTHMRHIMEKLAVSDRTQAAVKALKEGLVSL